MKKFIDINSKDGILVTCSYRDDGQSTNMKVTRTIGKYNGNAEVAMIGAAAKALKKDVDDDAVLVLPESTAIRVLTVRAAIKNGDDVLEATLKDWMPQDMVEGLSKNIPELEDALLAHTGKLSVIKARTLYRWELTGTDEDLAKLSDNIVLQGSGTSNQGSTSEDGNVTCSENNYLTGAFKVTKRVVGKRTRYFVERMINVVQDGKIVKMSTTDAFTAKLEGNDDTANRILNLLLLRTKTAEALPRVIRKTQVTVVDA